MSAFPIMAIGIAQLSCLVVGNDPRGGKHLSVDLPTANTAVVSSTRADGSSYDLEADATVTYGEKGALRIASRYEKPDFTQDPYKDQCYAFAPNLVLELEETSYANYKGTWRSSFHLDQNPFFKEPCPMPMPLALPPVEVVCVAAIH